MNRYSKLISKLFKLDHGANRAKDFLLHNLHVSIDAGEKCWLDVETICSLLLASAVHRCAITKRSHVWVPCLIKHGNVGAAYIKVGDLKGNRCRNYTVTR